MRDRYSFCLAYRIVPLRCFCVSLLPFIGRTVCLPLTSLSSPLGLQHEGIYRKNGAKSRIKVLMEEFRRDARNVKLRIHDNFIEDVTDVLKRFFRELEDPVFTTYLHPQWKEAAGTGLNSFFLPNRFHTLELNCDGSSFECTEILVNWKAANCVANFSSWLQCSSQEIYHISKNLSFSTPFFFLNRTPFQCW